MTDVKTPTPVQDPKPKATRTPRSFDDILRGAKALTLKERADLVNALIAQNQEEAKMLAEQAAAAAKLVG